MCTSRKSPSPKARAPMEICPTVRPMQRVAMDILGPLPETPRGNKYILVVGDHQMEGNISIEGCRGSIYC